LTAEGQQPLPEDRRICSGCVGEAFLAAEIKRRGRNGVCSYCDTEAASFTIEEMATEIEIAFDEHYYLTASEPSFMEYLMSKDEDIGYDWEREGDTVTNLIVWCAEVDEEIAQDIQRVLQERHYDRESDQLGEENPFDDTAHYAGRGIDDTESRAVWLRFEESITTEARYFNPTAEAILSSVFEGITDHRTHDERAVIVEAGPGSPIPLLYRARVFQSEERLIEALKFPDKEVGPPPSSAATNGRMNPHGVAVFYGATDPQVALAEVRPPVGSKVVVGRFEIIRPLRLLDIEALREVNVEGSVFDRGYIQRKERAKFLQWLSKHITQPVMPDDQTFEYLPTQAIADLLASQTNPALDGILYPSIQVGEQNLNVVLFHKASRVESLDTPNDTEISVSLSGQDEEVPSIDYWVSEHVPPAKKADPAAHDNIADINDSLFLMPRTRSLPEAYDPREPTLHLDVSSVEVHYVSAAEFTTESGVVQRHRFEKQNSES
jgi:hypothetical protein